MRGACGQSAGRRAQAPALYDVEVRHVRHAALHRDFRHRVYLWLVDLDELPRLPLLAAAVRPVPGAPTTSATRAARSASNLDRYLAGQRRSTCAAAGC